MCFRYTNVKHLAVTQPAVPPAPARVCVLARPRLQDFTTLFNEIFLNAIMGWTLGTGFYVRWP